MGPVFGSSSLLVIQAHQESIQEIFIRSSSDFLICVYSSAIPESPKVRMTPVFVIKIIPPGSLGKYQTWGKWVPIEALPHIK
jgi:hypothetical protein